MKKLTLLSLFFSLMVVVSSCKKEENNGGNSNNPGGNTSIAQEQKAVAFYLSGNWCGPCGQYGKPAMKSIEAKNGSKLVVISCQLNNSSINDPMNCPDANSLAGVWAVNSVPTCAISGNNTFTKVPGGGSMESGIQTKLNEIVAASAVANSSIDAQLSGTTLTVKTKTKFFSAVSEDYVMGVYLTESNISGRQYSSNAGWDENAVFNHVLRTKISSDVVGDALTTGATAGQEVTKDFTINVTNSAWAKNNLHVVTVLWKKVGNSVSVVNGSVAAVSVK